MPSPWTLPTSRWPLGSSTGRRRCRGPRRARTSASESGATLHLYMTASCTQTTLSPSLFARLALVRDLATRGITLLSGTPNAFDGTQGLVLLDLAIETLLKVVVAETGRRTSRDSFRELLDAIPELAAVKTDILALHDVRNAAQHRGAPPSQESAGGARRVGLRALRDAFRLVGADYETLSTVPQLGTSHFREPLERALALARERPADGAALAACAMKRVRGWIAHITGDALVPEEMWVFHNGLWEDVSISAACADSRDDFLRAMLDLAAGAAMGISPPSLIRFSKLAEGHRAAADRSELSGFRFEHDDSANAPAAEEVRWMVELVARSALRFEEEWPDFVLVAKMAEPG